MEKTVIDIPTAYVIDFDVSPKTWSIVFLIEPKDSEVIEQRVLIAEHELCYECSLAELQNDSSKVYAEKEISRHGIAINFCPFEALIESYDLFSLLSDNNELCIYNVLIEEIGTKAKQRVAPVLRSRKIEIVD